MCNVVSLHHPFYSVLTAVLVPIVANCPAVSKDLVTEKCSAPGVCGRGGGGGKPLHMTHMTPSSTGVSQSKVRSLPEGLGDLAQEEGGSAEGPGRATKRTKPDLTLLRPPDTLGRS